MVQPAVPIQFCSLRNCPGFYPGHTRFPTGYGASRESSQDVLGDLPRFLSPTSVRDDHSEFPEYPDSFPRRIPARLVFKDFFNSGLCAFNLGGEHPFFTGKRREHHRGIDHPHQLAVVSCKRSIGLPHRRKERSLIPNPLSIALPEYKAARETLNCSNIKRCLLRLSVSQNIKGDILGYI